MQSVIPWRNGIEFNLGAGQLAPDDGYTLLPEKSLNLQVFCTTPTHVSLTLRDSYANLVHAGLADALGEHPYPMHGLSTAGRTAGGYALYRHAAEQMGDGQPVDTLYRQNESPGLRAQRMPITTAPMFAVQHAWRQEPDAGRFRVIDSTLIYRGVLDGASRLFMQGNRLEVVGQTVFRLNYL